MKHIKELTDAARKSIDAKDYTRARSYLDQIDRAVAGSESEQRQASSTNDDKGKKGG